MYHLRMTEEVKSCFSTCFLSILPFQKIHGKASAAAAGATVNFRAGTMLRLCRRGHCSPERLLRASLICSHRMLLPLLGASSKTQRAYFWDSKSCPLQTHRLRLIDQLKVHVNYRENTFSFLFNHRGSFSPSHFLEHNFLTGYKFYLCS